MSEAKLAAQVIEWRYKGSGEFPQRTELTGDAAEE